MKYFSKSVPPPKTFQRRRRIFLPSFFRSVLLIASKWGNFLFLFLKEAAKDEQKKCRRNTHSFIMFYSFHAFNVRAFLFSHQRKSKGVQNHSKEHTTDEYDQIRQRNVTFIAAAAAAAIEIAIIAAVVLSSTEEKSKPHRKK